MCIKQFDFVIIIMSQEMFNTEESEILGWKSTKTEWGREPIYETQSLSSLHPLHPLEDKNIKRELKAACRGSEDLLEQA